MKRASKEYTIFKDWIKQFICVLICIITLLTPITEAFADDYNKSDENVAATYYIVEGKDVKKLFDFTIGDIPNIIDWVLTFKTYTVIKEYEDPDDGDTVYKVYYNAPNLQSIVKNNVTSVVDDGYTDDTYDVNATEWIVPVGENAKNTTAISKYGFSIPNYTYMGEYPKVSMSPAGIVPSPKKWYEILWRAIKALFGASFLQAPTADNFASMKYLNHTYLDENDYIVKYIQDYYLQYLESRIVSDGDAYTYDKEDSDDRENGAYFESPEEVMELTVSKEAYDAASNYNEKYQDVYATAIQHFVFLNYYFSNYNKTATPSTGSLRNMTPNILNDYVKSKEWDELLKDLPEEEREALSSDMPDWFNDMIGKNNDYNRITLPKDIYPSLFNADFTKDLDEIETDYYHFVTSRKVYLEAFKTWLKANPKVAYILLNSIPSKVNGNEYRHDFYSSDEELKYNDTTKEGHNFKSVSDYTGLTKTSYTGKDITAIGIAADIVRYAYEYLNARVTYQIYIRTRTGEQTSKSIDYENETKIEYTLYTCKDNTKQEVDKTETKTATIEDLAFTRLYSIRNEHGDDVWIFSVAPEPADIDQNITRDSDITWGDWSDWRKDGGEQAIDKSYDEQKGLIDTITSNPHYTRTNNDKTTITYDENPQSGTPNVSETPIDINHDKNKDDLDLRYDSFKYDDEDLISMNENQYIIINKVSSTQKITTTPWTRKVTDQQGEDKDFSFKGIYSGSSFDTASSNDLVIKTLTDYTNFENQFNFLKHDFKIDNYDYNPTTGEKVKYEGFAPKDLFPQALQDIKKQYEQNEQTMINKKRFDRYMTRGYYLIGDIDRQGNPITDDINDVDPIDDSDSLEDMDTGRYTDDGPKPSFKSNQAQQLPYRQCMIYNTSDDESKCESDKYTRGDDSKTTITLANVVVYSKVYETTKKYRDQGYKDKNNNFLKLSYEDAHKILLQLQIYCGPYYEDVLANMMKLMAATAAWGRDKDDIKVTDNPGARIVEDDPREMPYDIDTMIRADKDNFEVADPRTEIYKDHIIGGLISDFTLNWGFGIFFKPQTAIINIAGKITEISVFLQTLCNFDLLDDLGLSPASMWGENIFVTLFYIAVAVYFIIKTVIAVIKMGTKSLGRIVIGFGILVIECGFIAAIAADAEGTWSNFKTTLNKGMSLGEVVTVYNYEDLQYLFNGSENYEVAYYLPYLDTWSKYNTGYGLMADEQVLNATKDYRELKKFENPQIGSNDIKHYSVLLADSFTYHGKSNSVYGTLYKNQVVNGETINNNAYRVVDHFLAPRTTIGTKGDNLTIHVTQNENYNNEFQTGFGDLIVKLANCCLCCFLSLVKTLIFFYFWYCLYIFIFRVVIGLGAEGKKMSEILIHTFTPFIALILFGAFAGVCMLTGMSVSGLIGFFIIVFMFWLTFRIIIWWHDELGRDNFPFTMVWLYTIINHGRNRAKEREKLANERAELAYLTGLNVSKYADLVRQLFTSGDYANIDGFYMSDYIHPIKDDINDDRYINIIGLYVSFANQHQDEVNRPSFTTYLQGDDGAIFKTADELYQKDHEEWYKLSATINESSDTAGSKNSETDNSSDKSSQDKRRQSKYNQSNSYDQSNSFKPDKIKDPSKDQQDAKPPITPGTE